MPEFIIRIEDGTGQRSDSPVTGGADTQNDSASQEKKEKFKTKSAIGDYITSRAIIPAVKSALTHCANTTELRTGSQELQQRTDAARNAISTIGNIGSNIAGAGAIFGSWGPALVVGLVASAISIGVDIALKQHQINQQARLENEQISLYRSRLGAAYSGNRTGGVR